MSTGFVTVKSFFLHQLCFSDQLLAKTVNCLISCAHAENGIPQVFGAEKGKSYFPKARLWEGRPLYLAASAWVRWDCSFFLFFYSCCKWQKNYSSVFYTPLLSQHEHFHYSWSLGLLTTGISSLRWLLLFNHSCLALAVDKMISSSKSYSGSCSLTSLSFKGVVRPEAF